MSYSAAYWLRAMYAGEYEQRSDVQAFADEMQTRYNLKKEDALEILSR
ncbi:MAG: hypothetical protein IPN27_10845 [Cellvibrionales bacterium]|nr:hypothetical protein [Cellvibrionales bacterium]